MKRELLEKLAAINANENFAEGISEGRKIMKDYDAIKKQEFQEAREKYLKEEGEDQYFELKPDETDLAFDAEKASFIEKKKAIDKAKSAAEQRNFELKREVLDELKALLPEGDNLGQAFSKIKEIRERWAAIGNVPQAKFQEVQGEYSRLIDDFNYNINIFKEIKEYDLKKNLELKLNLIERLQILQTEPSLKKVEELVKAFQVEWDEIGPTHHEKWPEVREKYKEVTNAVYQRLRDHYNELRDKRKESQTHKEEHIAKMQAVLENIPRSSKKWKDTTQEVLQLQETWTSLGFASKAKNEELWEQFRALCDSFFTQKKAYFESMRVELEKSKALKNSLIEEVEKLKASENFKEATTQILKIQERWKSAGATFQRDEQRLWKSFRTHCDEFFTRKKEFFSTVDVRQTENLQLKEALIAQIEAFKISGNRDEDLAALREFSTQFNQLGHVPFNDKQRVFTAYKKAIDARYSDMKMNKEAEQIARFENKLQELKSGNNTNKMLFKERDALAEKIRETESTIKQYENNLGFFANSRGADSLKKDVESKIAVAREELKTLQKKLKMLYDAGKTEN